MKQRSLSRWFLALFGISILGSLFFYMVSSNDHEGRSFTREHDRFNTFNNRLMGYPEHNGFHHHFEILPVLFILLILLTIIWLLYRRFKNHQARIVNVTSFSPDPLSHMYDSKADFLDEWEKNTQTMEGQQNGNLPKN